MLGSFWVWLSLSLAVFLTVTLFKRGAVLFWAMVAPVLVASRWGMPAPLIFAACSGALVGLSYHAFWGSSSFSVASSQDIQSNGTRDQELQSLPAMRLCLPFGVVLALTVLWNMGLIWLVLRFTGFEFWVVAQGWSSRGMAFFYLLATFPTALGFFLLFVRPVPDSR